jgi:hypothetical protein
MPEVDVVPFANVLRHLYDGDLIAQALASEGPVKTRNRKLPPEQVIALVVGMALFRNWSISEVVRTLELTLPKPMGRMITSGAIAQARQRLGVEPLEWLFERTAEKWGEESAAKHTWRGLTVLGLDGTKVNVPENEETRSHFGLHGTQNGPSGYPAVRIVTVMLLRSHMIRWARLAPFVGTSEQGLARDLIPKLPARSLTVLDRGFWAADLLIPLARDAEERHWLTRARAGL